MKNLFYHMQLVSLFTFIWIILNENIGLIQIITGIMVSIITIVCTNNLLLVKDYKDTYKISPIVLSKYLLYLIIQIYKSGISSINKVIRGQENVAIYQYKTDIKNELGICMLANAITLTPGTVTIDKVGQELTILYWEDSDDSVQKIFEDILKEGAK